MTDAARDVSARSPLPGWFREHARFCDATGAPLYGVLLRGMADDHEAGGPTRSLCADWDGAPRGAVVQLRLLAALHRLVLTRRAPELATFYRSVGGTADPAAAWPVARALLAEHLEELRPELAVAPQTNEPGRAAPLAVGLWIACARTGTDRVRLLEIGASAGLNLLVDRFRVTASTGLQDATPSWAWGPADSPVDLTGTVVGACRGGAGAGRPTVRIVGRRGCDLEPVDPLSAQGRLRLTSFVWPDHEQRHRRLAGALEVARQAGPGAAVVDRESAAAWLHRRLAGPVEAGVLTVVWHSVMWQYLDDAERAAITRELAAARERIPLTHVRLESTTAPYDVDPVLSVDGEPVGTAPAHGVPITLASVGSWAG